jgi:release factor glutamine methyltransferase
VELYTSFGDAADEGLRTRFRELVKRRAEGVPVAYLVGQREFYSLPFRVTPDVLIPRPETEFVVLAVLDLIKARGRSERPMDVADVGTGSGVIGISVARHAPQARVLAIDTSAAALAVARENARRLQVAERMEFVESDLFEKIEPSRQFDVVVSNPPYVSQEEFSTLPRDVREHEPAVALVAGASGMSVIERLVPQAAERLRPEGALVLEISPMLQQRVEALVAADERLVLGTTIKDSAGLARVVVARRK